MRHIPSAMATQHPDNARAPFWDKQGDAFISSREETLECVKCFEELGVGEFMWDWEGKYADEAVVDRLFGEFHEYFKKHKLGKDIFLTFRIPNVWKEKGHSLLRALMVVLTAEDFARDLKFHVPPLFELILPMTEKPEELMYIKSSFRKLARFKTETFNHRSGVNMEQLDMIPLVENVERQLGVGSLLARYIDLHKKEFKSKPVYIRPFLARSDPALVSGIVSTVLANKIALSDIREVGEREKVRMFPILGAGSLPFRGGLNPDAIDSFASEYKGVRTVTIQSAFRYDYNFEAAAAAVEKLNTLLPKSAPGSVSEKDRAVLLSIIKQFEASYAHTLQSIAGDMEQFFRAVPRRRERRQHIGLLRYARQMGKLELPRAINFTAAFYSIGIPPEFLGLRALKDLSPEAMKLLFRYYRNIEADLKTAGAFVNKENLKRLIKQNPAWARVEEDLGVVESIFGFELGPRSKSELMHERLSSSVFALPRHSARLAGAFGEVQASDGGSRLSGLITETGVLRKSLG